MQPTSSALLLAALLAGIGCRGTPAPVDTDSDTEANTDSADGPVTATSTCADPRPLPDTNDALTGYVICEDGGVDRESARPARDVIPGDSCPSEGTGSCATDGDCTAAADGRCTVAPPQRWDDPETTYCGCRYSCATDAECGEGRACVAGVATSGLEWSQCMPAECRTNADCESQRCGLSAFIDDCGNEVKLVCRTEADVCASNQDCEGVGEQCAVEGADSPFVCRVDACDQGRPLLVDGVARVAPEVARDDWGFSDEGLAGDDDLSEDERRLLAAHWSQVAALEHASVASFSRFALQLMALGAPADLVSRAHQAALDEVRHAQISYSVVTALTGAEAGPGPLDLSGVTLDTRPIEVLRGLIAEACTVETLAVSEVREAAAQCRVPGLRARMTAIADDEQEHAALAWSALSWLLDAHPELREVAVAELSQAVLAAGMGRLVADAQGHPSLGILGAVERRRVHRIAAREVLRPAMAALLGPAADDRSRPQQSAALA